MNMSQRFNEFAEKVDALQFVFSGKKSYHMQHMTHAAWVMHIRCIKMIKKKLSGIYLVIIAGALLSVIGFFGCYGALRENRCFLGLVSLWLFWVNFLAYNGRILIKDKMRFYWARNEIKIKVEKCLYDILLMSSRSFC